MHNFELRSLFTLTANNNARRLTAFRSAVALALLTTVLLFYFSQWSLPNSNGRQCACRKPGRPQLFADPQVFHAINGSTGIKGRPCTLVYSAFFDHRDTAVKVVADSDASCYQSTNVACQIWYPSLRDPYVSDLLFYSHMLEQVDGERLGAVYACNARPDTGERPVAVSFFAQDDACMCSPLLSMRIHQPQLPVHKFAACIPALYGYILTGDLIAFIEMHRLLGVEKFYFYKEFVSEQVEELLRFYQSKGVAEVLSWKAAFPEVAGYHNQQAMQQDCSLRNLQQSTWVAQFDIDEVIMPANGLNWSEMVANYETSDTGVFTILNRDYTTDESVTCDDQSSSADADKSSSTPGGGPVAAIGGSFVLYSANLPPFYFRRLSYYNVAFSAHDRSKIIFRPERTEQARTHYALLRPGFREVVLGYDKAVLAHYRYPPRISSDNVVRDTTVCAYRERIAKRILSTRIDD